jgi:hypothetical protein
MSIADYLFVTIRAITPEAGMVPVSFGPSFPALGDTKAGIQEQIEDVVQSKMDQVSYLPAPKPSYGRTIILIEPEHNEEVTETDSAAKKTLRLKGNPVMRTESMKYSEMTRIITEN